MQESFSKPLHSDALIEITRRFLKGDYFERPKPSQLPGEVYTCEADAEASRYNVPEGYPEELIGGEVVGEEEEGTATEEGVATMTRYPGSAHQNGDTVTALASEGGVPAGFSPALDVASILQPSPSRRYSTAAAAVRAWSPERSPGQTTGEANARAPRPSPNNRSRSTSAGRPPVRTSSAGRAGAGVGTRGASPPHVKAALDAEEGALTAEAAGGPAGMFWSLMDRLTTLASPSRQAGGNPGGNSPP